MTQQFQGYSPADRISTLQPYFFARLNKVIQKLQQDGMNIIRLDMGSPDLPPPDFIIQSLVKSVHNPDTHGYTPFGGTVQFKNAVAEYYSRRFNVQVDPNTQVVGLIGSKEGLFNFGQAMINPGDYNLVPDPGYPVYETTIVIAGGKTYYVPINEQNNYVPDLDTIPEDVLLKTKIMWMNYPNNPTGAIATEDFLKKTIQVARKYKFIIAFDAPYTDVCYDGYIAPSILEFPGAMDVCLEFNSLSKTYNMPGWRIGMAVGNPDLVKHLATFKSQVDSSNLKGILDAGVTALTGDQTWLQDRNQIYCERRDVTYKYLAEHNFPMQKPKAGLYIWFKLIPPWTDDVKFCSDLLHATGVSLTPGSVYGEQGRNFVRISLATPVKRIQEAMERMSGWLTQNK